jgi:hypothetical protein
MRPPLDSLDCEMFYREPLRGILRTAILLSTVYDS